MDELKMRRAARIAALAGCAGVLALTGCGGSSNGTTTTSATESAPAGQTTSASDTSPAVSAIQKRLRLQERLRRRIQANMTAHGRPTDPDATCRVRKLKYGPTSQVADRYDEQVASQLHILCPQYFLALGESRRLDRKFAAPPAKTYTSADPEFQLAQIDKNAPPSQADVRPYARLLDDLDPRCTGGRTHVADLAVTAVKVGKQNHGLTLTNLQVLRAVAKTAGPNLHDCKYDFVGVLQDAG